MQSGRAVNPTVIQINVMDMTEKHARYIYQLMDYKYKKLSKKAVFNLYDDSEKTPVAVQLSHSLVRVATTNNQTRYRILGKTIYLRKTISVELTKFDKTRVKIRRSDAYLEDDGKNKAAKLIILERGGVAKIMRGTDEKKVSTMNKQEILKVFLIALKDPMMRRNHKTKKMLNILR